MDVSNASLYDGASALAEAVLLSSSHLRRNRVFVSKGLNPKYLQVLKTYCEGAEIEISDKIDEETACVIAQYPDFFGNIEDLQTLADEAKKAGALFVTCVTELTSLAILKPPANFGSDIVVGEGQSLGIPMSYGAVSYTHLTLPTILLV